LHFVDRAHFNFDRLRSTAVMVGPLERRNDASGERDMVVLDEYPLGEVEAMILAAAAADAVLVDGAQARDGLSRIKNTSFCTGDGIDELPSQRRDAAHTLHEIENDTLAGEDNASIVPDDRDGLTRMHADSVENFGMAGDLVVRNDCAIENCKDVQDGRDN